MGLSWVALSEFFLVHFMFCSCSVISCITIHILRFILFEWYPPLSEYLLLSCYVRSISGMDCYEEQLKYQINMYDF